MVHILFAVKLDELTAVFKREIVTIDMINADTLVFVLGKIDFFYFHASVSEALMEYLCIYSL